jgi:nitrate/TMAO reductase-like tetraheme cytochrome c subunit
MGSRARGALLLGLGVALVGILAVGLSVWLYTGPASAHPGNSCDPDPGHGTPGCHVDAATTATTAVSTTSGGIGTTEVTTGSTSTSNVVPSSGPATSPDPNALQMFADKNNCLSCHGDPSLAGLMTKQRPDGTSIALYVDTAGSANSVHRYKDCTSCHGDKPHDVKSPLTKLSLSEKCGTCHEYEYDQYKISVHGAPQQSGNSDPATCTDCHSATSNPHNVVRVLDPAASTYPKNIAQTCATCHDDPKLMDKYGIVEKVYGSYMRSFHGKAMNLAPDGAPLQQLDTATCVNCHGAHNIALVSDPNAPVAGMENLLETCKTCHPDAGPEFVKGFLGHKAVNSDFMPEVYWGGRSFYIFSRAMLAGGVLIVATSISLRSVPWAARRIKRRKKKEE